MTTANPPPIDSNSTCVGPDNEMAGKVSSCEGCPNQQICASGPQPIDPALEIIDEAMAKIKKKILVLSGKGGVGKSTVSTNLSWLLSLDGDQAEMENDAFVAAANVGLLDLDITGPSIPTMLGCVGEQVHQSNSGWAPVCISDNLSVMSIGFMLPNPDEAVIWRGPKKNGLIKQFLKDVDWGELDYLIVDTPPGTSDEHLSIVQYLKGSGIHGAVVVTTPQEMALQDVRKEINFCKKVGVPIIGVIENMSGFVCPNCTKESLIFAPSSGGARQMCLDMNVSFLGSIPIDPRIAKSCDLGLCLYEEYADSPAVKSYKAIIQKIKDF